MNDEPFFDLAMKVIAGQGTDAERAEVDALLAREPKLREEFERLQTDARIAKGALPLVEATQATTGELPAYARGRLQTKVRQTLGRPAAEKEPDRSLAWGWRWFLGVATATAVVLLVILPMFHTPNLTNTRVTEVKKTTITSDSNAHDVALLNETKPTPAQISPTSSEPIQIVAEKLKVPIIQLAMLDMTGGTRGSDTNEVQLLRQGWNVATIDSFSELQLLRAWETNWPGDSKQAAVKIIYDRAAAELRVLGRKGGNQFSKTFPVEGELAITLKQAQEFVREQTKR